jgi:hypothetical protein
MFLIEATGISALGNRLARVDSRTGREATREMAAKRRTSGW